LAATSITMTTCGVNGSTSKRFCSKQ